MKQKLIIISLFTFFLSVFTYHGYTDDIKIPKLTDPVMDEMGMIKPEKKRIINRLLKEANKTGRLQMAVYVTKSLYGYDIESFSMKVAEKWKLGRKGIDEGLLLLIAPNEKKLRLEVGYGLEGVLTDSYCGWIIRKVMIPHIKKGRFGNGIIAAIAIITQKLNIKHLYIDNQYRSIYKEKPSFNISAIITIIIFSLLFFSAFFFIFIGSGGLRRQGTGYGRSYRRSIGGFSGGGGYSGGGCVFR